MYERSKFSMNYFLLDFVQCSFSICIFMCTVCNIENILYYLGLKFLNFVAALIDITWFYQGLEEFKTIVIRNSIVKS